MSVLPHWRKLLDHVMSVPEKVYEGWNSRDGWDNNNAFGKEFGENLVPWCVIFDWCMYHDVQMDGIVPKVDNVVVFSNYARKNGQWSEYPSVGAWVNLGNGHTEIVVGFDKDTVYTKGGNSVKAGATDAGQGNGVWSHATLRRSSRVVGYFAPKFADGICPPTADPKDYRGGAAVDSYRWSGPYVPPVAPPQPGTAKPVVSLSRVIKARHKDLPAANGHKTYPKDVTVVEHALHAEGLLTTQYVDGSWGTMTDAAYHLARLRMGYKGKDAEGDPGMESLKKLGAKHGFSVVK
jgi:hypothetical protein